MKPEDYLSDAERAILEEGDDDHTHGVDDGADTDLLPDADDDADDDTTAEGSDDQSADDDADAGNDDQDNDGSSDKDNQAKNADKEALQAAEEAEQARKAEEESRKTRLSELESEIDALSNKFDEGDLTSKEYREQLNKLQTELREIEKKTLLDQAKSEAAAERAKADWEKAQADFFRQPENKRFSEDENLLLALNNQVVKLAKGEMANATGPEILAKARANVAKSFGITETPAAKEDKGGKPARPARPKALPDIGGMPAAAAERPQDGKFAYLDKLSGEALEDAVDKLSKAEQEEWESR
jgi:hypothetical protein